MDSLTVGDSPLTERETDVLRAAADGAAVAVIAHGCTSPTAPSATTCPSAIGKTGAANRSEAVQIATSQRLAVRLRWLRGTAANGLPHPAEPMVDATTPAQSETAMQRPSSRARRRRR